MATDLGEAQQRRAARAPWPIASSPVGEEPPDDISQLTTPGQRIAMAWFPPGAARVGRPDAGRFCPGRDGQGYFVHQIGLPPLRIDVMTEISGVTFDEAWTSRVTAEVEGRAIGLIGKAALVKNKEAAGRPKDIADVARFRRRPPTP